MDSVKRKHIMDTAMKMFIEYGFHNTPTSKIAKEAKVSVGTLFNYFPTKEELIKSIYIEVKTNSKKCFQASFDESQSDYEVMKQMWRSIIIWGIENPMEFKFIGLFTQSSFKYIHKDATVSEQYSKLKARLARVFTPNTMCTQYKEFTMVYMNSLVRATTEFLVDHEVQDQEHFIASAFDLFWGGISNK